MGNCTDNILERVCKACSDLRILDISNSLLVTDKSITAITSLKQLEALDVFGTSITPEGTECLLQSLPSKIHTIGCNHLSDLHRFHKLKSLHAGINRCNAILPYLQHLNLSSGNFDDITGLLGNQLVHLQLNHCKSVDVSVIIRKCTSIEVFEMHSCSYSMGLHQALRDINSGFKKLRHFILDNSSKFPSYPNIDRMVIFSALRSAEYVREIQVQSYANFDEGFFSQLMRSCSLKYLDIIYIHTIYSEMIQPDLLRNLLVKCLNISELNVRGLLKYDVEDLKLQFRSEFPGVRVNFEIMDPSGF